MIPYTVDRRPDTGVTNVTMGIWLFIASEVMLFGALFSAYALLRTSAPVWPSGRETLNVPIGSVNTVVLVVMTAFAWRARQSQTSRARVQLLVSSALGITFLALKALEYRTEIASGWVPATSTFFATYFTLTGVHALHVAAGVIANVWVIAGSRTVPERLTAGRIHALTIYWTFVDFVWLILFVLLYVS